ncbi:peroxiredoxin [Novosphingobium flavum]|uniref:thioredoxin-dependent peroxiredoxin n=1 Tax=Novosphingobium flavum TaxID=1778672 RepID=A0A7X1FSW3_9SPHN|nr:peroxiredoxin [Novosphingobium flavum]MBC2666361.1 peroxiredoxin [Novosphingobium flavum]
MVRRLTPLAALTALVLAPAAHAALPVGAKAPEFATQGALDGKPFAFDLKKALKKGPVVLYFYPKAFTQGCTLEAHAFSEASDDFHKSGATIIGMSNDALPVLQKFSTEACRGKFAVASATPKIVADYDVDLKREGVSTGLTSRTSYVIAPNGKVVLVHSDMNYADHVKLTLAAVQGLKRK